MSILYLPVPGIFAEMKCCSGSFRVQGYKVVNGLTHLVWSVLDGELVSGCDYAYTVDWKDFREAFPFEVMLVSCRFWTEEVEGRNGA